MAKVVITREHRLLALDALCITRPAESDTLVLTDNPSMRAWLDGKNEEYDYGEYEYSVYLEPVAEMIAMVERKSELRGMLYGAEMASDIIGGSKGKEFEEELKWLEDEHA